jgi:hypothetical protein
VKKYWEFWKDDEKLRIFTLRIAVLETLALALMVILFGYMLGKYFLSPKPVYVVTSGYNGVVIPSQYQGEVIYNFTQNYLSLLYSFTPANFDDRVKEAENLALPAMYQSIERYARNIKQTFTSQNYASSISFTAKDVAVKIIDKNTFLIKVNKANVSNYYDSVTNAQKVSFDITIVKGNPSLENPFGLYVSDVKIIQEKENNGG